MIGGGYSAKITATAESGGVSQGYGFVWKRDTRQRRSGAIHGMDLQGKGGACNGTVWICKAKVRRHGAVISNGMVYL